MSAPTVDKENIRFHPNEEKRCTAAGGKVSSRGNYFDMASDISKEININADQKIAIKAQCKDISELVEKICDDYERDDAGKKKMLLLFYFFN